MENSQKKKTPRSLDFEVNSSLDFTKMLTGALMDVRRGEIDHESARSITLIADKLNKHNTNEIDYKKVTGHNKVLDFFEDGLGEREHAKKE